MSDTMPRCETCRYWTPTDPAHQWMPVEGVWGECEAANAYGLGSTGEGERGFYVWGYEDFGLKTRSDFGCVAHQPKGPPD